ncbi:MAG: Hsp20/alpha crystallin family protein [Rubrivivax sp.]|jgi:HSP20 family protein
MTAVTRLERMDDLFPEVFRRFMRPMTLPNVEAHADIRLDISERETDFLVRAEVPGAKKEDVRVEINRNYVSISTEVKKEQDKKDAQGHVLLKESSIGSAMRGFSLPVEIDQKAATAKLENGVLTLTLPKLTGAASRQVSVE